MSACPPFFRERTNRSLAEASHPNESSSRPIHLPNRSAVNEQASYHRPVTQFLSFQDGWIGQGALHDYAPVSDDGHLVGEVGDVHFDAWRIEGDDLFQPAQEPRAPCQHTLAIEAHHGLIEEPILIGQGGDDAARVLGDRSEEHTSELQSLMRISYAVFCLK